MSAEENKRLLARGFDAMNTHDLDVFAKVIGENYVNHSFPDARGPEGFRQMIGMFFAAFPDMHVEVADMIAEGDKVASRGTWRGTHKGEFMGIPATGKPVEIGYCDVWRFEHGKGVENWVQMDTLDILQQLDVRLAPDSTNATTAPLRSGTVVEGRQGGGGTASAHSAPSRLPFPRREGAGG